MEKFITYDLYKYESIAQALSNKNRLKILQLLTNKELNINDISQKLKMPMPTVTVNIQKLEESGLIICKSKAGKHGKQKICSLKFKEITLKFFEDQCHEDQINNQSIQHEPMIESDHSSESLLINQHNAPLIEKNMNIKLGSFTKFYVKPECGIASLKGMINKGNFLATFSSKERIGSEVLWFNDGYVSYEVPLELKDFHLDSIEISFEACSEHMFFNNNWPSDITLWINEYEVGTYTTEGYFGEKASLTPDWWPLDKPQHGELVGFILDNNGTFINGKFIHSENIKKLINEKDLRIKIGIKQKSNNSRGIMIFGENFGNYKQDISVKVKYKE